MAKPLLMWLEERQHTAGYEVSLAKARGFKVDMHPTPVAFMDALEDWRSELERESPALRLAGFVIDIMIIGCDSLDDLGVEDSGTMGGTCAGIVFTDRVLRALGGAYRGVPVCLLTDRDPDRAPGTDGGEDIRAMVARIQHRSNSPIALSQKQEPNARTFGSFLDVCKPDGR